MKTKRRKVARLCATFFSFWGDSERRGWFKPVVKIGLVFHPLEFVTAKLFQTPKQKERRYNNLTEEEMEKLTEDLRAYLDRQGTIPKQKPKRKGIYSKVVVALCILLAVGYTGICLLMQWTHGIQPEPQLTIAFFGFVTAELWSLSKIKRSKNENNRKDE